MNSRELRAQQKQKDVEAACAALELDYSQRDQWVNDLIKIATGMGLHTTFAAKRRFYSFQERLDNLLLALNEHIDLLPALAGKPGEVLCTLMAAEMVGGLASYSVRGMLASRDETKEALAQQGATAAAKVEIDKLSEAALRAIFNYQVHWEKTAAIRTLALGMIYELTNGFATIKVPVNDAGVVALPLRQASKARPIFEREKSPTEKIIDGFSKAQKALLAGILDGIQSDDKEFIGAVRALVKIRNRSAKPGNTQGD